MLKKLGLKTVDRSSLDKQSYGRAQKKVESRNFDIRKTLIKFDDVMNDQRQVIFSQRLSLKENDVKEILNDFYREIIKLKLLSLIIKNQMMKNI